MMVLATTKALSSYYEPDTAKLFMDTHSQLWEVTVVIS